MSKRLENKKAVRRPTAPRRRARAVSPRPNRFHTFLKRLRSGGRSNMYGAIPYLMHAFSLDREAAFRVVCEYVDQQAEEAARASDLSPDRR